MPWVDAIAKEYGLEFAARERAAGVAREMAAAGYTTAQARSVVLGMLHGTKQRLKAAWSVFVDAGEDAVLSRAEWHSVLSLITGGLGMRASDRDQLFTVFDQDGSGSLDFSEFCQVLDSLPLQRAVDESPFFAAISALQSLMVLDSQLLERLSLEQLASAGRIISRLRGAGFSDQDAARVIQAIFLSRSRSALREAWAVLHWAAAGAVDTTSAASSAGASRTGSAERRSSKHNERQQKAVEENQERSSKSSFRRSALMASPATSSSPSKAVSFVERGSERPAAFSMESASISAEGFKRLLPLLGEDLPLARVERLFEEADVDASGTLDFEEFVTLVRRLKPKAQVKNGRKAAVTAFESLTKVRGVQSRALRRAVPVARRPEAGLMVLTMRDFGYDDEQIMAFLSALYPPPVGSLGGADSIYGAEGIEALESYGGASASMEGGLRVVRAAWHALGGGDLVRLPVNPFNFRTRAAQGHGLDAKAALIAQAERWQCAAGIDLPTFSDLLTLLGESMAHMGGQWPDAVIVPLTTADDLGGVPDLTIGFAQFCAVIAEMRDALDAAAAARADGGEKGIARAPWNAQDSQMLAPFLALQGPRPNKMSDESFHNPLRRLARRGDGDGDGDGDAFRLRDVCPAPPSWLNEELLLGLSKEALGELGESVAEHVKEGFESNVVGPLIRVGEKVDPLMSLGQETRQMIPKWQAPIIAQATIALREHGFPPKHAEVLIRSLYLCREKGDASTEAASRAWRVLRFHASRFEGESNEAGDGAPPSVFSQAFKEKPLSIGRPQSFKRGIQKRARIQGGGGAASFPDEDDEAQAAADGGDASESDGSSIRGRNKADRLPIDETFRYDHHMLEVEACRRMLRLFTAPLMKQSQLEALFSAFDVNRDGAVSFDELERLLRMLDPYRRLRKIKPIEVPKAVTKLDKAKATVVEAVTPAMEAAQEWWATVNPFRKDEEDEEDVSFVAAPSVTPNIS